MAHNTLFVQHLETPLGKMTACVSDIGLCLIEFSDIPLLDDELMSISKSQNAVIALDKHPYLTTLQKEIECYFSGDLTHFSVPLHLIGTPFQVQIWESLIAVPYGTTRTYLDQAIHFGNKKAIRAIAHANAMNKIAIVVPCHRIIGSNGKLTGYKGGIERKRKLLIHEKTFNRTGTPSPDLFG